LRFADSADAALRKAKNALRSPVSGAK
jgi:hypothetical protein